MSCFLPDGSSSRASSSLKLSSQLSPPSTKSRAWQRVRGSRAAELSHNLPYRLWRIIYRILKTIIGMTFFSLFRFLCWFITHFTHLVWLGGNKNPSRSFVCTSFFTHFSSSTNFDGSPALRVLFVL